MAWGIYQAAAEVYLSEQAKGFVNNILATATWETGKYILGGPLLASFGVAVSQYIRHRPVDWWGILALFVVTVAVLWFGLRKRPVELGTAIQQMPAQAPAGLPGIPTLSSLLGQDPNVDFDAKKFFALAHYSPVTAEIEKNIRTAAHKNAPSDPEAFYARFIGIGVVAYQHDVTWFTIYGSQLEALLYLNSRSVVPVSELQQFYIKAATDYPDAYWKYSFDQWISFMRARLLLAVYPSQM